MTDEEMNLNGSKEELAKINDKKLSALAKLLLERDYVDVKDAKSMLEHNIEEEINIFRERNVRRYLTAIDGEKNEYEECISYVPIGVIVALFEYGLSLKDLRNLSVYRPYFLREIRDCLNDRLKKDNLKKNLVFFESKKDFIERVALSENSKNYNITNRLHFLLK